MAEAELVMGSDPPALGVVELVEWEGADAATCTGAVALDVESWSGINFYASFADREVGTASTMVDYHIVWHPTDPDAGGGQTQWAWQGTLVIAEWSSNLIRLDLVDGTRCTDPELADCAPDEGTLTLSGERDGPFEGQNDHAGLVDVESGAGLCGPPVPG